MSNICIFTQTLQNGGAEKQALLLAKSLSDQYKISVLVYYGGRIEPRYYGTIQKAGISVLRLSGGHASKFLQLYRLFNKENYDVVFSYLLLPNLLGGVVGKIAGIKNTIGGIRSSKLDKKKRCLNKLLQNKVNDFTIYNNYAGFEKYANLGFKETKALVIPNGFEIGKEPISRKRKDTISILSVGRFHDAKDYKTALKAIKIASRNYNIRYTIVGWGELEGQIRQWISELALDKIVRVLINPDNLDELYETADIFLQTSIFEGLSNTLMEAMSFSLPIVSTNVGDSERLVLHSESGYLCSPGDSEQIAVSLQKLCNDAERCNLMGQRGYRHLQDNYSLSVFRQRYIDFIESLDEEK